MSGYPLKVKQLSWDAKSRLLATGGGEVITVWNVAGRGPAGTRPLQLRGHKTKLTELAFQNTGAYLASGDAAGRVRLWRPAGGVKGVELAALPAEITALAWAPDDHALGIGAADGRVSVLALPDEGRRI
jgi:WD40 repeat protein